jgi:CHASE3 domain sensor protein
MKKLFVIFLLILLIAGSAFAQSGNGYNQTAQTLQTISGTLQIINGILAIVNAANQVYYVSMYTPPPGYYFPLFGW